jgi:hypothetical protein
LTIETLHNKKIPSDHDKTSLKRQIDYTDSEIDALVYNLYALTPDEIEIVEGKGQDGISGRNQAPCG